MSIYIILNAYLQYFKKIYNRPTKLKMASQRDRLSQEFVLSKKCSATRVRGPLINHKQLNRFWNVKYVLIVCEVGFIVCEFIYVT